MRSRLVVIALVLASSCRPATRFGDPNQKATFRGYGVCGFEGSRFLPCGTNVPYWLNCDGPTMGEVVSILDACEIRPCSVAGVYIELEGELSEDGSHGHLGAYKRELTPTHVYYANGVAPEHCGWTPPDQWIRAWN